VFWLYVWHVEHRGRAVVYVGRTGDNSSCNAASPMGRLGEHLNVRRSASANMLLRHLRDAQIDPIASTFRLVAVGPILPEECEDFEEHKLRRNVISPMEAALWQEMVERGYDVVGQARSRFRLDAKRYREVLAKFEDQLAQLPPPQRSVRAAA
jgi:hypothetical protein